MVEKERSLGKYCDTACQIAACKLGDSYQSVTQDLDRAPGSCLRPDTLLTAAVSGTRAWKISFSPCHSTFQIKKQI